MGVPRGWVARMKRTIRTLGWRFNTDRMVIDYAKKCYLPAARRAQFGDAVADDMAADRARWRRAARAGGVAEPERSRGRWCRAGRSDGHFC